MCGIVGYLGDKHCSKILYDGLKMLEYRGYDSVGIATIFKGEFNLVKKQGRVSAIEYDCENLQGKVGIGHTRWATHGEPSSVNAHPHLSERFALVHNGIVENYQELKTRLIDKGVVFNSETDTEVIVHLIESCYKGDFFVAVKEAVNQLIGSFAIAVICKNHPKELIVVKKDNPVLIGKGEGEFFIASDISALAGFASKIYRLEDREIAVLKKDDISFYAFSGEKRVKESQEIQIEKSHLQKNGYESFMLKEIYEIPQSVTSTAQSLKTLNLPQKLKDVFKSANFIKIIGCGTAYHSGLVGKILLERARVRCETQIASEFRYSNPIVDKNTLVIAVSQSGETADTLAGVKLAKKLGAFVLVITNVPSSSITDYADYSIITKAGQEIAVAATKSYCSQLVVFYFLAEQIAKSKGQRVNYLDKMQIVAKKIREVFSLSEQIKRLASRVFNKSVFFIGRGLDYAVALEASLKLKEITYLHSEGYAGGELKHGTLALIDNNSLVVSLQTQQNLLYKMENAVKEVEARGASVIIVSEREGENCIKIPQIEEALMPLVQIVPLQLFAYFVSRCKGLDADKPRNLAKSVTVE